MLDIMKNEKPRSAGVLVQLRDRILYLDYSPGEVIAPTDIASTFSVSVTPIREALIQLEGEGLIKRVRNRSFQVTEVSLIGVKGLFEVKLLLNRLTGELAARRISAEEIGRMEATLEKLIAVSSRREILRLDEEMHKIIDAATRNEELQRITQRQRYHILRLWYYVGQDTLYEKEIATHFSDLLKAVCMRDEEKAGEALYEHLEAFIPIIQSVLHEDRAKHPVTAKSMSQVRKEVANRTILG